MIVAVPDLTAITLPFFTLATFLSDVDHLTLLAFLTFRPYDCPTFRCKVFVVIYGDAVFASAVCGKDLIQILDEVDKCGGLPETILYTLNPSANDELASVAGSFRNVKLGAAWWFNDHKTGIIKVLEAISAIGYLGVFYGMLTDSRSFLSYPRHDYFRRILCSYIADLYESGEVIDVNTLYLLAKRVSCENIEKLIGERK